MTERDISGNECRELRSLGSAVPTQTCSICNNTGMKDYLGFGMDECDHLRCCENCGGDGGWEIPYAVDYRNGATIDRWQACEVCDGTGSVSALSKDAKASGPSFPQSSPEAGGE